MPVPEIAAQFTPAQWNTDGTVLTYGELGATEIVANEVARYLRGDTTVLAVMGSAERVRLVSLFDRYDGAAGALPQMVIALNLAQPNEVPGKVDVQRIAIWIGLRFELVSLAFDMPVGKAGWATFMDYVKRFLNTGARRRLRNVYSGNEFFLCAGDGSNAPATVPGPTSYFVDRIPSADGTVAPMVGTLLMPMLYTVPVAVQDATMVNSSGSPVSVAAGQIVNAAIAGAYTPAP